MKSLINATRNNGIIRKKKFRKKNYLASLPHTRCVNNVKVEANKTIKVPEENMDEYLTIPEAEKIKGDVKGRNHKGNSRYI